jgi:hypothetical protein
VVRAAGLSVAFGAVCDPPEAAGGASSVKAVSDVDRVVDWLGLWCAHPATRATRRMTAIEKRTEISKLRPPLVVNSEFGSCWRQVTL